MKKITASPLFSMLILLMSFVFIGCYTQLAFVQDEQYMSTDVSNPPIIIVQPPIYLPPPPIWDPPPPAPVFNPLPSAGNSSTVSESSSQQQRRDVGYQRASQSNNSQESTPVSVTRPGGSNRGGR